MPSTPSEKPGEDPSQWPDLQPWLRGMCSSMPLLAEHRDSCTDKGALRLSDLQFRVSRLELQVSQIGGLDDKHPSNHEVCELRKHVQASQAELQATRQEARETQEQLKLLLLLLLWRITVALVVPSAVFPPAHKARLRSSPH